MKQKKGITPVVATALLLVVAVVAVMGFQNWFNTYQAGLNTNVEQQSNSLQNSIEITNVIGNNLYIKSSSNTTLSDIKINSRDCKLSPQLTAGMNIVDIGSCISGLNTNSLDVSLIGTNSIKTKTFYTDSTSQKEFVKFLGYYSPNHFGNTMIQTANGNFAFTGREYNSTDSNALIIKTDSSGNQIWNKTFSFNKYNSSSNSIIQTLDKGFVIVGQKYNSTNHNVLLIKTDSSGNQIWNKTFSFNGFNSIGYSIIQTSEGGFIIAGQKYNSTNHDVLLIKMNSSGNEIWNKTFSFNGFNSIGYSMIQTADGGFAITGDKYNGTNYNSLTIKTDSSGNQIWNKTFSFNGFNSIGYSMIQTSDGGFAITGQEYNNTNHIPLIIKMNSSGNELWNKTFNLNTLNSIGFSIIQTANNGFAITGMNIGQTNSTILLIKTDNLGNELLYKPFNYNSGGRIVVFGSSIIQAPDGGFFINGRAYKGIINNAALLIKTDSNGNTCDYNATGQC